MRRRRLALALALLPAGMLAVGFVGGNGPAPQVAAAEPLMKVGLAHAEHLPVLDGTKPIFILLLGDNYRKGIEETHLTDSIHILAINPEKQAATILGFPRDSWVPIPGHGNRKINEAYHYGGERLAIQTVENLTGLRMDYYAVTTFTGFRAMVSEVGNVVVKVPYPIDDSHSKADFDKGKEEMTGKEALAFVRSRYDVPGGDFGRSENQGRFLISMLAQFKKQFREDPSTITRYLGAVVRNVETDVPFDQLVRLGFLASRISPSKIENLVVPGSIGTAGDQSIVKISPQAAKIYKRMANDGLA